MGSLMVLICAWSAEQSGNFFENKVVATCRKLPITGEKINGLWGGGGDRF
jgi:hypothetical protein